MVALVLDRDGYNLIGAAADLAGELRHTENTVQVLRPVDGARRRFFSLGQSLGVATLAMSGDGAQIVAGIPGYPFEVRALATGALVESLPHHEDYLDAGTVLSPNWKALARASFFGFDYGPAANGAYAQFLPPEDALVKAVAFSPDSLLVTTGTAAGVVKTWTGFAAMSQRTFVGAKGAIAQIVWSANGAALAVREGDEFTPAALAVWRVSDGALLLRRTDFKAQSLLLSPDGSRLLAVLGREVVVLDVASGQQLGRWSVVRSAVDQPITAALSGDGQRLATSVADDGIRIWRLPAGEGADHFFAHFPQTRGIALSDDGKTLVTSGYEDPVIRRWCLP
jgi:WD40 repeat protein